MTEEEKPIWKDQDVWLVVGAFAIALPVSWFVFFEVIQPALVSLSPAFTYNPDGYVGRSPDSLAQVALFATILSGLFVYYLITVLIFEGFEESFGYLVAIYYVVVLFPIGIIKVDVLPIFGVDKWNSNPKQNDLKNEDCKDNK